MATLSASSVRARGGNPESWLWAAWGAASFTLVLLAWLRHWWFSSTAWDAGFYLNELWQLSHGHWQSGFAGLHVFADHFSPLMVLLSPLARLPGTYELLELAEAGVLMAGIFPAYKLAQRQGRGWIGAAWYGLAATLWHASLYDVRPMLFGPPILMWMLWRASSAPNQVGAFLLGELLLIGLREDLAVLGAVVVLMAFARGRERRLLAIAGVGMAASAAYVTLGTSWFGDGYLFWDRYHSLGIALGDGPMALARLAAERWLDRSALVVYLVVLGPMLLLPLPGWRLAWPGLALVAANLMADIAPMRTYAFQYQVLAVPFLVAGGLAALERHPQFGRRAILISVTLFLAAGPLGPNPFQARHPFTFLEAIARPPRSALAEVVERVAPGVSVSASEHLVPHLAEREQIYRFPIPLVCPAAGLTLLEKTSTPQVVALSSLDELPPQTESLLKEAGYQRSWQGPAGQIWQHTTPVAPQRCPPTG